MLLSALLYDISLWGAAAYLLLLLTASFALGIFLGRKRLRKNPNQKETSFYIEATLLSLLIGFTFSLASGKNEKRRSIFTDEINAISTVYLRTGMYPDSIGSAFKKLLLPYVDERINYFEAGSDEAAVQASLKRIESLAGPIFDLASKYAADPQFLPQTQQLIPALNTMFDLTTTREIHRLANIPISVVRLLVVISLIVIFLIGYNHIDPRINLVAVGGYILLIIFSFMLILDMGNAREGNVRLTNEQAKLIELRNSMS